MAIVNVQDLSVKDPGTAQLILGLGTAFQNAYGKARQQSLEAAKQQDYAGLASLDLTTPEGAQKAASVALKHGDVGSAASILGLSGNLRKQANEAEATKQINGLLFGGGQQQTSAPSGGGLASLIQNESGGRWDAQNNVTGAGGMKGHFGRLQFGQARLQEAAAAGAIPQGTTPQQFMASPELQKRAEAWHFNDIDNAIKANGYDQLVGKATIAGAPVTVDGLRAVAHLGGKEGMRKFVETGGRYNPADANGTRLSDYFVRHGGGGRPTVQVANTEADVQRLEAQMAGQPVQMAQAGNVASDAPAQGARAAQFAVPGQASSLPPGDPLPQHSTAKLQQLLMLPGMANHPARSQIEAAVKARQQWAMDGAKATDVQRNYEAARKQGYQGTLLDYQKELRPGTSVNIDQRSDSEFAKASGKAIAERVDGLAKEGDAAAQDLQALGELRQLGGRFQTGGTAALQGWLAERGIKVGADVGQIEAYTSLVDKLTPQQRVPGSGATSDFDAKMFKASLPRLINTPEGNELILGTLEKLADNRIRRAEIATRMQTGELPVKDGLKALSALQQEAKAASMEVREKAFGKGGQSQAQQPAQQQAPAQFSDGATAFNPQTKQRIIFRNGQWVPFT